MLQEPLLISPDLPVQIALLKECSFFLFPLDSRDNCSFDALLQLSEAKIFSEPIKMISCSMVQSVSWIEKHFKNS